MIYRKYFLSLFLFCIFFSVVFSQEALKSTEDEYYNFLSLSGYLNRPSLGYRTLSDSVWTLAENDNQNLVDKSSNLDIWSGNNLGITKTLWKSSSKNSNWYLNGVKRGIFLKIYGPEWFNSYNTAAPYGQNDGALWQGKGYNTSLTTGIRFEGYGLELTLKPQLSFSQNLPFDYITPAYSGSIYNDKAATYGYYGVKSIDAPQRFGDSSFWTFDWGDSEVRYTWNTFTVGFGTQSIWLGPAQLNPILHSNNAASYPKLDVGLRRTSLYMPWFGWYLGDVEGRVWTGYLTESDYFDNDSSNDHNMINAMSISYSPPFLKGLTVGANRVFQSEWDWDNLLFLKELVLLHGDTDGSTKSNPAQGNENQIASIFADWLFPTAGLRIYGELGIDDHVAGKDGYPKTGYLRYPFHTMVYNIGLQKRITINNKLYGELQFEWTNLEMSQDFQFQWPYTFYAHSQIKQGYTNRGQWLGVGNGTGGNSQYLGFNLYYPNGSTLFYIHRSNPDNNYLYSKAVYEKAQVIIPPYGATLESLYFTQWKASLIIGVNSKLFVLKNLIISGGFGYNLIINPQYKKEFWYNDILLHNFRFEAGLKYIF